MKIETNENSGLVPRQKEKELQNEGLKREHTHPKKEKKKEVNEDPNGMTAKTLKEMKKKLNEVPHTSAATKHDGMAYDKKKK
jgi:hypothetical protein